MATSGRHGKFRDTSRTKKVIEPAEMAGREATGGKRFPARLSPFVIYISPENHIWNRAESVAHKYFLTSRFQRAYNMHIHIIKKAIFR